MGIYTGERLSTGAEERVVNLLSQGEPVSRIAKKCRMSVHSVMAIRERRSQAIADRKRMIAASAARLAAEGFDQLNERLRSEKISTALLVPITGMATDKLVALSNDPQQINVTHTHEPGPNLYAKLSELAARLSKPRTLAAQVEAPAAKPALLNGETISDSGAGNGLNARE
jgi:hypothetical protein